MGDQQFCFMCGELASAFGLQEMMKISTCGSHVSELHARKLTIYDIEGFSFINSPEDASEFDNRRGKREVACEKLTLLQSYCDEELSRATEEASAEIVLTLEQRHQEIAVHLRTLRGDVNNWVGLKTAKLTRVEECLTSDLKLDPNKARGAIRSLVISLAPQLKEELENCILESSIETGGTDTQLSELSLEEALANLLQIGQQCDESEAKRVINGYIGRANQELDARQIENCVRNWQSALSLLSLCFPQSKDTANAHFELGLIYFWYLTRDQEAETAFESSLAIERSIKSRDSSRVLSYLGLSQCYLWKFQEAEKSLNESLAEAANSEESAIALCFLGRYYHTIERLDESETTLAKAYESGGETVHALAACYLGDLWNGKRLREAEEKYLEAISCLRYQPDIHRATSLSQLGSLHENRLREQTEARDIYLSFPKSILMALSFTNLGILLGNANRLSESKKSLKEALEIYRSFPKSIDMAFCLLNMGALLRKSVIESEQLNKEVMRLRKANTLNKVEQLYKEAIEIYRSFSKMSDVAYCLKDLGSVLRETNRASEAEQCYKEAMEIYRSSSQMSDVAECSLLLGRLLGNTTRASEGEKLLKEAMEIYRSVSRMPDVADCLYYLGLTLRSTNRVSEAEKSFKEAMEIYRSVSRMPDVADCLYHLGSILRDANRASEAEQLYKEAIEIYRSVSRMPRAAECLFYLGSILRNTNRASEAEQLYKEVMEITRSVSRMPDLAECFYYLGVILRDSKRFSEAEQFYQKALELHCCYSEMTNTSNSLYLLRTIYCRRVCYKFILRLK